MLYKDTIEIDLNGVITPFKIDKNLSGRSGALTLLINDSKYILKIFKSIIKGKEEIQTNYKIIKLLKLNTTQIIDSGIAYINGVQRVYYITERVKPFYINKTEISTLDDLIRLYCKNPYDFELKKFILKIFKSLFKIIQKMFKNNIYHCDLHTENVLITETKNTGIKYLKKNYKIIIIDMGQMKTMRKCVSRLLNYNKTIMKTSYECSSFNLKAVLGIGNKIIIKKINEYYNIHNIETKDYRDFIWYINILCASSVINYNDVIDIFTSDLNFKECIYTLLS